MNLRLYARILTKQWLRHPLRTGLVLSSFALATFSILTVLMLIAAGKEKIQQELNALGPQNLWVWRDPENRKEMEEDLLESPHELTQTDLTTMTKMHPGIVSVTSCFLTSGKVTSGGKSRDALLYGVTPPYFAMNRESLSQGRFFTEREVAQGAKVCLLPEWGLPLLFQRTTNPVGETMELLGEPFTLIGTLKRKDQSLLQQLGLLSRESSLLAYLPLTTLQNFYQTTTVSFIQWSVIPGTERDTQKMLFDFLQNRKGPTVHFKAESLTEYLSLSQKVMRWVSLCLVFLGGISLVTSGIGTTSLLLLSVSERKAEIGLKKAMGGTEGIIFFEFLAEAMLLATLGTSLGSSLVYCLNRFWLMPLFSNSPLPWQLMLWTLLATLTTSVLASLYPAMRGAKLSPIIALKSS